MTLHLGLSIIVYSLGITFDYQLNPTIITQLLVPISNQIIISNSNDLMEQLNFPNGGITAPSKPKGTKKTGNNCDPSYPDFCIPSPPPDLDCKDISAKNFTVLPPDPHHFDGDKNGRGCERK